MENKVKFVLALLLLICILNMPYGYYQLVRYLSMVGFAYLGITALKKGSNNLFFTYLALVILFQPIFKIALGRFIWNIIDVIVAIYLLYSVIYSDKIKK